MCKPRSISSVIRDCPDELWQANMWEVPALGGAAGSGSAVEVRDADGNLVTDPAEQHALVQWEGQSWGVAWHALEVLEANLTAHFVPWKPWAGFGGKGQEDVTTLSGAWSRTEMLSYVGYCRERVAYALSEFMEERAATPIGPKTYAERVIGKMNHLVEHATQLRQFVDWTASGLIPDPTIQSPTEGRWAKR
jgi:hypothetical protein